MRTRLGCGFGLGGRVLHGLRRRIVGFHLQVQGSGHECDGRHRLRAGGARARASYITTSTGTAQRRPAVGGVHPDATPSDSLCTGVDVNYYGWFGIEPGSTADGGLSGLWLDANSGASAVSVESGDGSTGQQWCEEDAGGGAYYFYEEAGTYPQCLTVISGAAPAT